jgi:AraC-like DNA-binding protein
MIEEKAPAGGLTMKRKIWMFFFIAVCIPTIAISSIYLYAFSGEAKMRYQSSLQTELGTLSSQIDSIVSKVDKLTLELSFATNLNPFLLRPEQISMYDMITLQNSLRDKISLSGMIKSAYLYFKVNDKILTTNEGLYNRDDFYDKALINRLLQSKGSGASGLELRQVADSEIVAPSEVLTVERSVPLSAKQSLGFLVVNIDEQRFFSTFENLAGESSNDVFIANLKDRSIFYQSQNDDLSSALVAHLAHIALPESGQTEVVSLAGSKYFVGYKLMPSPGWLLMKVIPYGEYRQAMNAKLVSTLLIGSVIMLLGLALSYLFSGIIYRPWRNILTSYRNVFGPAGPSRKLDEYALVSSGIDHLLTENSQIRSTMEQMEPMMRHKLIYDLLTNRVHDVALTRQLLEQKSIRFPHPYFVVCIVDCTLEVSRHTAAFGKMELLLFGFVESAFLKRFEVAGTVLDEGQFSFILNLPDDPLESGVRNVLGDTCQAIRESAQAEVNATLQFSFGTLCHEIEQLHESFAQAKRGLKYKALYGKSDVVFSGDAPQGGMIEYPVSLQKMLVYSIKSMNRGKAGEAISALFRQYVYNETFPPEKIHELMTIFVGAVISELLQEGYEMEDLNTISILQIDRCGNKEEMESLIRNTMDRMIGKMECQDEKRSDNLYIAKAIRFIEEQYRNNISIGDIAEHVGLSPNYLSRIFKNETGHPPLDYLTRYRIKIGKELLLADNRYSLQEVGTMIGYNDVQSFIRFFKKYEAVTPSVFRKLGVVTTITRDE